MHVVPCVPPPNASLDGVKFVARDTNKRKFQKRKLLKSEEGKGSREVNKNGEKLSELKRKRRWKEVSPIHMLGPTQYVCGTSLKICANCSTVAEKRN